jgi:hypothetical protein
MIPKRYRRESRGAEIGRYLAAAVGIVWGPVVTVLGPAADAIVFFLDEWRRWILLLLSVLTLAATIWTLAVYWGDWQNAQWTLLTGFPVGLFVLYQSSDLHRRFNGLSWGLTGQGILEVYAPSRSRRPSLRSERPPGLRDRAIVEELFQRARNRFIRHASAMSVLVGTFFAILVVEGDGPAAAHGFWAQSLDHFLAALEVVFGFVVGIRLGRIAAYGMVMWTYPLIRVDLFSGQFRVRLNPQPGHPDKVCGLKPIGEFWTFEAAVLIPPLAYTLAWIGVMNAGLETVIQQNLPDKHGAFVTATLILILLQIFALWVPMFSLRRVMVAAKHDLQARADRLAQEVASLKHTLLHAADKDERAAAKQRHEQVLMAFQDVEQVPRWPISAATIRSHVLQLWPILGFIGVENEAVVGAFAEFFQNI